MTLLRNNFWGLSKLTEWDDRCDTQLNRRWLMSTWLGRAAWAVQVLAGSRRQCRCGRHCLPYLRLWLSRSPVYSLWLCVPWSSHTLLLCVMESLVDPVVPPQFGNDAVMDYDDFGDYFPDQVNLLSN